MNFAKTILVFALFGPLVGLLVLILGYAATNPLPSPPSQAIGNLIFMMIAGIPFSYVFGIVPALAAGIPIAIGEKISRRFGFVHVALLGIVCGLVFALTFDQKSSGGLGYAVVKVLTCLVPTIACWMISRRWNLGQNEQSNEAV